MKTKNLLILIILIYVSFNVKGQQFPYFNHVYLNQTTINPGLTGIGDQGKIMLIQKNTLTGIPGNPKTLFLNAMSPIKTDKVGVGMSFYKESLGITSKTGVYGSYAYKLKLDEKQTLSFGLSLGALQFAIDPDMTDADNANDPVLLNKNFRGSAIDGSMGAYYTNRKFEAGLAVLQIFGKKAELEENVNFKMEKNVVGSFKYLISLNQDNSFSLSPMLIARYSKSVLPQDMLLIFNYKDRFWFVPSYNSAGLVGMSVSLKLYNTIQLGYGNEMYIKQPVKGNQQGGHEIMLSYSFTNSSKAFKKQQAEIDQLYKRLKEVEKNQTKKDRLQDEGIKENKDAIKENKDAIKENKESVEQTQKDLEKTNEEIERLKKQLSDAGLIREFSVSEYDGAAPGYYMVIASVSEVGFNQEAMNREFLNLGYKEVYNKKRGWHYVYSVKPDDFTSALKILKETRAGKHKDAWIHILK